jgi:hypothetical protein
MKRHEVLSQQMQSFVAHHMPQEVRAIRGFVGWYTRKNHGEVIACNAGKVGLVAVAGAKFFFQRLQQAASEFMTARFSIAVLRLAQMVSSVLTWLFEKAFLVTRRA